ncbi:hypothetical protein PFISCL1PPCAC_25429, partial [Pristionchus fissidentatus]
LLASFVSAELVIDTSKNVIPVNTFKCLFNSGYRYFIPRIGQSTGVIDQKGIESLKNAITAQDELNMGDIATLQVYIFPCFKP